MSRIILLSIILILALGCSKEENFNPVYNVPEAYEFCIKTFIQEASNRGHVYKIDNLIIMEDPDLKGTICGQCNSNGSNEITQKIISINPAFCWTNDQEREALIFHELGHCFLRRLHNNERLPNGDAKSIMIENNFGVYAPCVYQIDDKDCNNLHKRSYYLDELFNENTPTPAWGN